MSLEALCQGSPPSPHLPPSVSCTHPSSRPATRCALCPPVPLVPPGAPMWPPVPPCAPWGLTSRPAASRCCISDPAGEGLQLHRPQLKALPLRIQEVDSARGRLHHYSGSGLGGLVRGLALMSLHEFDGRENFLLFEGILVTLATLLLSLFLCLSRYLLCSFPLFPLSLSLPLCLSFSFLCSFPLFPLSLPLLSCSFFTFPLSLFRCPLVAFQAFSLSLSNI